MRSWIITVTTVQCIVSRLVVHRWLHRWKRFYLNTRIHAATRTTRVMSWFPWMRNSQHILCEWRAPIRASISIWVTSTIVINSYRVASNSMQCRIVIQVQQPLQRLLLSPQTSSRVSWTTKNSQLVFPPIYIPTLLLLTLLAAVQMVIMIRLDKRRTQSTNRKINWITTRCQL